VVPASDIKGLGPFSRLPTDVVEVLAAEAVERVLEAGALVVRQHDLAETIFVLRSGRVEFLIAVEGTGDLLVGATAEAGALIGWSVVREPHRYTSTVRCSGPCRLLAVPRAALERAMSRDPRVAVAILGEIAAALACRLDDARDALGRRRPGGVDDDGAQHA
jgi:CRP-like cAMP-binding protein